MNVLKISVDNVAHQQALLNMCFPKSKITVEYLDWLYFSNPLGGVQGFDAFDGDKLVSHYACIPTRVGNALGLLSLNTATHPDYRSKGIYRKLAKLTYESVTQDFNFVIGVANNQSKEAFKKYLGFNELGRLNLRFGELHRPSSGARIWSESEIKWRVNSPRQKFVIKKIDDLTSQIEVRPKNLPFKIKALVPIQNNTVSLSHQIHKSQYGFTVDWIRNYQPKIELPEKLKPSPLVLIYQSLSNSNLELNSWSFPDFDAF